jgi:hypothetical protein
MLDPSKHGGLDGGRGGAAIAGYLLDGLDILPGPVVAAAASGIAVVRLLLGRAAASAQWLILRRQVPAGR